MDKIYTPLWLELDKQTREHLTKVFSIPTSSIAEVRDQIIVSDGKTNADLSAITKEKMEGYVGSVESFPRLWELTLMKCKYELNPPQELPIQETLEVKKQPVKGIKKWLRKGKI